MAYRTVASLRIAHTYDFGTFAAMKSLLESEGVTVLEIAIGGHLAIAGADQGYYLQVLPEDRVKARTILRNNDLGKYIFQEER
ncbi:MAG: hypothetical protein V3R50_02735 [Gammaproteobacteria bacterium]